MTAINVIDAAAEARLLYGEHADAVVGHALPEHDWRFELLLDDGRRVTMHRGATAEHVAEYEETRTQSALLKEHLS